MRSRFLTIGLAGGLFLLGARATARPAQTPPRGKTAAAHVKKSRAAKRPAAALKAVPQVTPAVQGSALPMTPATPGVPSGAPPPTRGPTRLDFDDRLVQGQTNKSGAVYLYDRKELKNRSMVHKPESFREEIVGAVYDSP